MRRPKVAGQRPSSAQEFAAAPAERFRTEASFYMELEDDKENGGSGRDMEIWLPGRTRTTFRLTPPPAG